ncbi:MAG TPA: glycerate kinase [Dehalococcoidia bacterium]|nr:glycerate kinase [Dehalococcoidia bacterium]
MSSVNPSREMRILVAPQEFKGSLTASAAASAIAAGLRDALPGAEVTEAPMSDGGPGLVDALLASRPGRRIESDVTDPLGRRVRAAWAMLVDRTAIIEMAAASGLVLLAPAERDPLRASTYGTGELLRAALDAGAREVVVGAGGSATVDAGAGAMQALGARLLDARGDDLPRGGGALARLARIDVAGVDARLREVRVRVAVDVLSTLCGPQGAARMFGPQKGASPDAVETLEAALARFAQIALRDTGVDVLRLPGAGAAGGLAAGLAVCAGATIERGFDLVARAVGLEDLIARADAVITGEGKLDAQSGLGKTSAGVAAVARARGKPVVAIAGTVEPGAEAAFDATISSTPPGMPVDQAMRGGAVLLRAAGARAAEEVRRLVS